MSKTIVWILVPSVIALAAVGCSTHRASHNLPTRTVEPAQTKADLAASDAGKSTGHPDRYAAENKPNDGDREASLVVTPPETRARPDFEITQDVRRALAADGSLSATAKKVKIVTSNGVVTLGGAVGSEQERRNLASTAQRIAGVTGVKNETVVVR